MAIFLIPTKEPKEIRAGDTVEWTKALAMSQRSSEALINSGFLSWFSLVLLFVPMFPYLPPETINLVEDSDFIC